MSISLMPVRPEHVPELSQICYDAFGKLQDRHGVERDFDSIEMSQTVIGMFSGKPEYWSVCAEVDGKLLGSNFIHFADEVSAIGPITVHPDGQAHGVGKALMVAVMNEAARRGVKQIRLVQEAINTASLSLYTKLGFDVQEGLALMRPAIATNDDPRIRELSTDDLDNIDRISKTQYHSSRRNESEDWLNSGLPGFAMIQSGEMTGYLFPGFIGHGFARDASDMTALITHGARYSPKMFHKTLVPLSEWELHRKLLAAGCRTIKLMNYMTVGEYKRPTGAWIPSIGC